MGGPQPHQGEGQPAAGEEQAAAPRQGATESEGEWEKAGPPLVGEPLGKGKKGKTAALREQQGDKGHRGDTPETWERKR